MTLSHLPVKVFFHQTLCNMRVASRRKATKKYYAWGWHQVLKQVLKFEVASEKICLCLISKLVFVINNCKSSSHQVDFFSFLFGFLWVESISRYSRYIDNRYLLYQFKYNNITANSRQFIFPLTRPTPLTTTIISLYKQLWKPQVGRELGTT